MNTRIELSHRSDPNTTRRFQDGASASRRASVVFLLLLLIIVGVLQSGCDLIDPVPNPRSGDVSVMTRNVYVGADVNTVLTAAPEAIPLAVASYYKTVQDTDFNERAGAIADEIAAIRPHLIGLQEVALYRVQSPSDFTGNVLSPNATEVAQDFLEILLAELVDRKQHYRVVNVLENSDIELPATSDGVNFFDVRLTDRDVILARRDVNATPGVKGHFDINLPIPLPGGQTLPLLRGYLTANARVRGVPFTFANMHLETAAFRQIQEAQAAELLAELSAIDGPMILVGDLNSAAPGAANDAMDSAAYGMVEAAFTDAFAELNPSDPGYTCCQPEDLSNDTSQLAWRIDHIWYDSEFEAVLAGRVGADPVERTDSGLWPSDHAGVVALLRLARQAN